MTVAYKSPNTEEILTRIQCKLQSYYYSGRCPLYFELYTEKPIKILNSKQFISLWGFPVAQQLHFLCVTHLRTYLRYTS